MSSSSPITLFGCRSRPDCCSELCFACVCSGLLYGRLVTHIEREPPKVFGLGTTGILYCLAEPTGLCCFSRPALRVIANNIYAGNPDAPIEFDQACKAWWPAQCCTPCAVVQQTAWLEAAANSTEDAVPLVPPQEHML